MNLENKSVRQLGAYLNRLLINGTKVNNNINYSLEIRDEKLAKNEENTWAVCEIIENKIKSGENEESDFNLNDGASSSLDLEEWHDEQQN